MDSPNKGTVMGSFGVFFVVNLNNVLKKQSSLVGGDLRRHDARTAMRNVLGRNVWPGGRLNKKDGLTRYGDSHVKDKTS